ncbi:WD40 repeat domain-containing protein [Candidatus Leptofilum sp.]|uniref:WD40 repeat domain-containing protein n=1 Tax=Candidatus Leptofilum sp. TaxID=3241576 RepID=UPI003B59EBE6
MTTTTLSNGSNGRFLLIGGAVPALLIGLALLIAGLAFIPASQRPTSGVADLGPGFAFFFTLILLPAAIVVLGLAIMSRLPIRPLALVGGYGNLLLGIGWVALALAIGARDQQWLAGIMAALPGSLFIFTGLTGLAGWVQRGMHVPGWSLVSTVTIGLLVVAAGLGLVSGILSRSSRVVLAEAGSTPVRDVVWQPSSGLLLSGDEDGRLQQWSGQTATVITQFEERIVSLAISPQETALGVSLPEKLLLVDPADGSVLQTLTLPMDTTAYTLHWSPDGQTIAADIGNKIIQLFAADTGAALHTLQTDAGGVGQDLAWSPSSSKVAYAVGGGYIIIWDAQTGKEVANWRPNGRMDSLAWSPDGSKIAYYHITSINILDATTGELLETFDSPAKSDLRYLIWSPDGSKLAGGSDDGEVVVLDAENGRSLVNRSEHEKMIYSLAWSPDGTQLAGSSRDGQLLVWQIR